MNWPKTVAVGWTLNLGQSQVERLLSKHSRIQAEGSHYTEEETKKDLILPLFGALGWDVNNDRAKEVTAEETVSRGRVDYGFRIDGVTKFYVEAKPLTENLDDVDLLEQAVGYSYNKSVTWAVLTNFSRLILLNAEWKEKDPHRNIVFDLSAEHFVRDFGKLALLSRDSLSTGRLDREAAGWGQKTKKKSIDRQLLQDLNEFRLELGTQISRLNQPGSFAAEGALEEVVQRLLDRLIFIRCAEDRGLEKPTLLPLERDHSRSLLRGLAEAFREFDTKYDTRLFERHAVDELRLPEEVLRKVFRGLHETVDGTVQYDFNAINADVLGKMYEQYLALKLEPTPRRARLKGDPRHGQGIYYTPTEVVDFIVSTSLDLVLRRRGTKLEDLRLLDPACGSGSFLLRAFDRLKELRRAAAGQVDQARFDVDADSEFFATRVAVLKENLYGVDKDPRAVEITQLNLMIRAAESRRRLPTLERNVRLGDSLIADPAYAERPFDWQEGFGDIVENGGFDLVIGNPPWVQSKFLQSRDKEYYSSHFETATKQYDLFTLFVERGLGLLRPDGVLGFILPDRFLANSDYSEFRRFLTRHTTIRHIAITGEGVFEGVNMPSVVLLVQKRRPRWGDTVRVQDGLGAQARLVDLRDLPRGDAMVFSAAFSDPRSMELLEEIEQNSSPLGDYVTNGRGVEIGKRHPAISETRSDVPFLVGEDIDRYQIRHQHWLKLHHRDIPERDYKDPGFYKGTKILVRKTGTGINAVLDKDRYVIQVIYLFKPKDQNIDPRFLVGLLNSKLMAFYYYSKFGQKGRGIFPHLTQDKILALPIRNDKKEAADIADLAQRLLDMYQELAALGGRHFDEARTLQERADSIDREIDNRVFDLYRISDKDREFILLTLARTGPNQEEEGAAA